MVSVLSFCSGFFDVLRQYFFRGWCCDAADNGVPAQPGCRLEFYVPSFEFFKVWEPGRGLGLQGRQAPTAFKS
jgi:hypothetical protein